MARHDTDELRQLVQAARAILKNVGGSGRTPELARSTGRRPELRIPPISTALLARLPASHASQIIQATNDCLRRIRNVTLNSFEAVAGQLQSLETFGISDYDAESKLLSLFESRYLQQVETVTRAISTSMACSRVPERANGFHQRTTCILEASFGYTTTPTVADVDRLAQLTGLQTHQVRTWFQNKRNRRNKRVTSGSAIEGPTQVPHTDGRRVASLPSRAKPGRSAATAKAAGRATRPLPKRYVPSSSTAPAHAELSAAVPLERTRSSDSDSTNFSFSSIPSNGGFTAFTYPTIPTNVNTDAAAPSMPSGAGEEQTFGNINFDQLLAGIAPNDQPDLALDPEIEALLNSLAPPSDDFATSADFDAQIQAAMRHDQGGVFANLNLTLAPSPSSSLTSSGSGGYAGGAGEGGAGGSPLSDWSPNLSQEEWAAMDMMKVFLDLEGVSPSPTPGLEGGEGWIGQATQDVEMAQPMQLGQEGQGRSESPAETIANIALNSGRATPEHPSPSSYFSSASPTTMNTASVSVQHDTSFDFDFDLDFEKMELDSYASAKAQVQQEQEEGEGTGWMMGVLPFETVEMAM